MARKKPNEKRQAAQFAAILVGALALLALWSRFGGRLGFQWGVAPGRAPWLAGAAAAIALVAGMAPGLWLRGFRLWMKLAEGMSWVMTRVILSVFFFVVLTPVGRIRMMLGKSGLDRAWRDGQSSYWKEREPPPSTFERYQRQY